MRADIQLIVDSNWVNAAKISAGSNIAAISKRRQEQADASGQPTHDSPISLSWLLRLIDAVRPPTSVIVNDLVCQTATHLKFCTRNQFVLFWLQWRHRRSRSAAALACNGPVPKYRHLYNLRRVYSLLSAEPCGQRPITGCMSNLSWSTPLVGTNYNVRLTPEVRSEARIFLDNPPLAFTELSRAMRVPGTSVSLMQDLEGALAMMFEPGHSCSTSTSTKRIRKIRKKPYRIW